MKIVFVFGSDGPSNKIQHSDPTNIGDDTRKACDTAVSCCYELNDGSFVVVTAGVYRPKGFNHDVWLAKLMAEYIQIASRKTMSRAVQVIQSRAKTFDTSGEAKEFCELLPSLIKPSRGHRPPDKIVLVAKDWHMARCRMLVEHHMKSAGISLLIEEEPYTPVSWPWWHAIIREPVARLRDWLRIKLNG